MRRTIRIVSALAFSVLPAIHAAQADTVIDTRPAFVPGFMTFLGEKGPQFPMRLWREPGQVGERITLRRIRAPRTWRTAGPMAKRQWRAEQHPMLCPAPIRRCTTDSDCERRNPCVLPEQPRHSL
jgi:hypothetical protein